MHGALRITASHRTPFVWIGGGHVGAPMSTRPEKLDSANTGDAFGVLGTSSHATSTQPCCGAVAGLIGRGRGGVL
eukprot:4526573-Pyramimonas_sp.AAC.1